MLKLAAAVLLVTTGVVAWFVVDQIRVEHEVLITAHRGSSQRAPENTLAALRAAVEDGADLVEIDVQTTRDGVVVVIHDHDLMRVADMPRKVSELDLAELQALDIGSWFGADFAGEHVPTLREAIQVVRGDTRLLVEIKNDGSDPRLAERVVEVLREENFSDQCLVMSLDLGSVRTVRRLAPDLPVGLIVSQSVGNVLREDLDFVAVRAALATVDYVSRAHALGKDVHAWTVNDAQVASALVDRGVDNLITDVPESVRAALVERAELDPAERLLLAYRNRRVP